MDEIKSHNESCVIDFVEYKISQHLKTLVPSSPEHSVVAAILDIYLQGLVDVTCTGDDIMVKLKEGKEFPENFLDEDVEFVELPDETPPAHED